METLEKYENEIIKSLKSCETKYIDIYKLLENLL